MRFRELALLVVLLASTPTVAAADATKIYPRQVLASDASRFEEKFAFLWEKAILPNLTPAEARSLRGVRFELPYPKRDDPLLNFYAGLDGGKPTVWLPLISVKLVEDLSTAYAWLWDQKLSFDTIDLYAAMLRWKEPAEFPGGHPPAPLPALSIPGNALENPRVDDMSLRMRNSGWAFVLLHELGHLRHGHRPYAGRPLALARANEAEADAFALEILERTGTIPMGAILFFQAQAYSLPNRGQFADAAAWERYARSEHTHPLSTERLGAMAQHLNAAAGREHRPAERDTLRYIATRLVGISEILEDPVLQRCIAAVADQASPASLAPRREVAGDQMRRWCGKED